MYSLNKTIRTVGLTGAICFAVATARAVSPPPDGGYPNYNTAEGESALFSLATGSSCWDTGGCYNTAIGFDALYSNTIGSWNTAIGKNALYGNTIGIGNTATGLEALQFNTNGSYNTATGGYALRNNTTGQSNTASGEGALYSNTIASNNTAYGRNALFNNATGSNNTAIGFSALINATGNNNTATGFEALFVNTTGINNTAIGVQALYGNYAGNNNTTNGYEALFWNGTGSNNTAGGLQTLYGNTTGSNNTAYGRNALVRNTSGSNNTAFGYVAGSNLTTGRDNIMIGNSGVAGESGRVRIGTQGTQTSIYIAGISGVTVAGGVGVVVNSQGKLGVLSSSARYKEGITPMGEASEAILALQPVTFRYKAALDPEGIPQFGLVAEEVAKVDPDLVARDESGKPYTVRYEAVNAMLLNEFLKEHRKVEEQEVTITQAKTIIGRLEAAIAQQQEGFQEAIARQEKEIGVLTANLKAQASQIEKVSEQLAMSRSTPQTVASNQ